MRRPITALVLTSLLAAFGCGGAVFNKTEGVLVINEAAINFGDPPVLTPVVKNIAVSNIGHGPLTVNELDIPTASQLPAGSTAFQLTAKGIATADQFLGGTNGNLQVTFLAPAEGSYSATLVLKSDDSKIPDVSIALTGTATTTATAVATPTCLNFGNVCEDHSEILPVTITSTGTAILLVNSLGFANGSSPAFGPVGSWNTTPPLELSAQTPGQPSASQFISVVFQPTAATVPANGMATGTLQIGTNDPLHQDISVCLTGAMRQAPVANAGAGSMVTPGSTVMLDGSASTDPSGGTLSYQWTLASIPQGSAAALSASTANTVMTSFVADLPGSYVASLTVTDGVCTSSQPATVTTLAIVSNDLLVKLVWDNPVVDLDLHLTPAGQALYGPEDCWWSFPNNDQTGGGWGTGMAHDFSDVLEGFGPETIDVQMPSNGQYIATVVYANGNCTGASCNFVVNATVEFSLYGITDGQVTNKLTMPGTFPSDKGQTWTAATVTWPSGTLNTSAQ